MARLIKAALASLAAGIALSTNACATSVLKSTNAPTCAQRLIGEAHTLSLRTTARDDRTVPLTVFAPAGGGTYPLIAFSHGAFAAPLRYRAMLEPLAAAGFIIVAPMHIDSEEYPRAKGEPARPPHPITWSTRNEDYALALSPPTGIITALDAQGLTIDAERTVALGHSYGALIAQLPGGAMAFEPDGTQVARTNDRVDAVVGWSPPGPMPGFMAKEGWASLTAPNLTITGTADILPGFIDDWRAHKSSYDYAPKGARAVWIGEGLDHYFGGVFGREKDVSETNRALFDRALATSLHFIERNIDMPRPCRLGAAIAGETYLEDK